MSTLTQTVHARYDTIADARRAIDALLEAHLPPRAITAEVEHGEATAYVPIGIGTRAVQGTIIGGIAGLTAGLVLTIAAGSGMALPHFLDGILLPNAVLGGLKAMLATGSMGVVAGAATGFARSQVIMAAPPVEDDDAVQLMVKAPTEQRLKTTLIVLARTGAMELRTT